ncbi:hypothetical protein HU200_028260 [Digitaria exilis]|uniref:KIB1-4 beta-propeller domain-containing protein n=1 Tax=Digitaria exilis TaxID=1010633 RepID=A0A835EU25_9POAL|nr:hypothetical protein HU200_028260 [Digitaria exilis]
MAAGKLRQGASCSHRGGGGKAVPCWSLHMDLTQLIAARVLATGDFLDYLRFRAVCSWWRAAAASPSGRGLADPRLHPRRWMLFPEGFGEYPGHPSHGGHARFFNLSASSSSVAGGGSFVRVPLPELRNHCILDSPDGLLLLQRDEDLAVRLLHPFTREIAELPSIQCLAEQLSRIENPHGDDDSWYYVCLPQVRRVRAAVDVTATGVVRVMLALERFGRVAFASDGDDEWTISSWKVEGLDRVLAHQGKLYSVNCKHGLTQVSVITPPQPWQEREGSSSSSSMAELPPPRTVATCSSEQIHLPSLVELDSEIMLVGYNDPSRSRVLVLRLADLALGRIVPVTCIGDCIIFPGERSLCVSSSWLPSIGSNSVVWLHPGNRSFGQYHLGTGAWSPASDEYLMAGAPARPCGLINHIFTCCNRQFW